MLNISRFSTPGLPRLASSGYAFLGAQHLLQAGIHFFFFNKLAPVGLCNAHPHGGAKAGIFLQQTQRGVLHQPHGVSAFLGGDLRKLCFLLRSEM